MQFAKMHGIGNDFVVVDARGIALQTDWPAVARQVCDRHFGIGSDGLVLVGDAEKANLQMRMLNPDGSEAEMCGNGIRCFARFAYDRGLVSGDEMAVETKAGIKRVFRHSDDMFTVEMGVPRLAGREIPVDSATAKVVDYPLVVGDRQLAVTCVSMGNPHAVFFDLESPERFPLEQVGPLVEHHPFFPQRVNFEVCQSISTKLIVARVWERGAGLTLACGTGACAIAVAAQIKGLIAEQVTIRLPGGDLEVSYDGAGEVMMTGPAKYVCEGRWIADSDRMAE